MQFNLLLLPLYSVVPSAAPTDLCVTDQDSRSVSLSWKPPRADCHNGKLEGYRVEIKDVNGVPQQACKRPESTSAKIDGLKSETEYKFHVSARTKVGSGPAATVSGRTNKEGKGCTKQICIVIIVVAYQNI